MAIAPDPQGGQKLIDYVGGSAANDVELAKRKYAEALALVNEYVGETVVPDEVAREAVLEVGSKLWLRRNAPNGQAAYGFDDPMPVQAPRDPLVTVYPTLNRYVLRGLA